MNEFIDKLIGKLEEKANQTWLVLAERNGYERAIEIVNQLAEEYNNESVKGDLISRSLLLDCLSYYISHTDEKSGEHYAYERAKDLIEKQPKSYNDGWIPCSSGKLPPKPENNMLFENKPLELYLATVRGSDYAWRVFWNGEYFTDGWNKVDVIAWQELPKVYKLKEGES